MIDGAGGFVLHQPRDGTGKALSRVTQHYPTPPYFSVVIFLSATG